jgi:hypothetical protein
MNPHWGIMLINAGMLWSSVTSRMSSKILSTVSADKAFRFYTSVGNYTGVSASSLKDFMDKINKVDVKSLEFHLGRGDFEKWTSEILGDQLLPVEIKKLQRTGLAGERLRSQLYGAVSRRFKYLSSPSGVVFSDKSV